MFAKFETLQMASEQLKTLEEYCLHFNCTFFNVHLPCVFCSHILTPQDLAAFACKGLNLVLRNSDYFACCINCCRLSARYEFDTYYQCCVRSVNIETFAEKHLHALCVRCYNCLKKLDIAEKYDVICRDDYFHLVRSQWRALCRDCTPK